MAAGAGGAEGQGAGDGQLDGVGLEAGVDVPDEQEAVKAYGDEGLVVGGEADGLNLAGVALELADLFWADVADCGDICGGLLDYKIEKKQLV